MLDLLLLGLVVVCAFALRDRWTSAEQREMAMLRQVIRAETAPSLPPITAEKPTAAAAYLEVAQHFVFSRDRNPTVILDPPAPPPPPPPPKPMPSLPVAYGVIDLGGGPMIFLADKAGGQQKAYKAGDQVGEFKLVSVARHEVVLEWDGKVINKRYIDLVDRNALAHRAPAAPGPTQAAAPKTEAVKIAPVKAGPGTELGATTRACVPGDTTPAGTVENGFRKVVSRTPFGESCRWEAVR
jgi:hypothetical protein